MWARVIEMMIGIWLVFSPFVFGHHGSDPWLAYGDFASGTLLVFFACLSFRPKTKYAHLASLAVVAWLVLFGYFAGGYPSAPGYQNDILVGLTLLLIVIIPNHASQPPESWRAFFRDDQVKRTGLPPA
ncbi:hypothetical protein [Vulgatibacter sp.]|uniref:SPW repeat domain-containing protein n=1 Tax=Vulgatibacter sp. TaxID=1971226 RepID=UPI003565EEC6